DRHPVERDPVDAVDHDPVLAADDGDVADRDAARTDDDAAVDDGAGGADEGLAAVDHERAAMHPGRQVSNWRPLRPGDPGGAGEHGGNDGRGTGTGETELAAVLGVAQPHEREDSLSE